MWLRVLRLEVPQKIPSRRLPGNRTHRCGDFLEYAGSDVTSLAFRMELEPLVWAKARRGKRITDNGQYLLAGSKNSLVSARADPFPTFPTIPLRDLHELGHDAADISFAWNNTTHCCS